MRIALVLPIDPTLRGNGAAQRAAFWRRALSGLGDLTTIVIDLISEPPTADDDDPLGEMLHVPAMQLDHPTHPTLARRAPHHLGARIATDFDPPFDLVVGFRSYVGLVCVGIAEQHECPVLIDLDDDDAALAAERGDADAHRWISLLETLRGHGATFVAANRVIGAPLAAIVANVAPTNAAVRPLPDAPSVVMLGNFTYPPNVDGAHWFLDRVWPLVGAQVPTADLSLVGPGSDRLEHGRGFVDDLDELLRTARLSVVPLLHGSGTRLKILDSWARGVPVVSTGVGADGLDASGSAALIGDTPAAFADHVVRLLRDDELANQVGAAGAERAERDHGESAATAVVARVVDQLLHPPVGPRRRDDLVATEVEDGLVIHDPVADVAHHLDPVAAMVFTLCDGESPLEQLVGTLSSLGLDGPDLRETVATAVALLAERRLLEPTPS